MMDSDISDAIIISSVDDVLFSPLDMKAMESLEKTQEERVDRPRETSQEFELTLVSLF
jgi:hypothetical protein